MLDEKRTVAALKEAYKIGGFHVAFSRGKVLIRGGYWAAEIEQDYIFPKVLGAIVEMIGVLPVMPAAYIAGKSMDPGTTCSLDAELSAWDEIRERAEKAKTRIRRTQLTVNGFEIWQTKDGLRARPMDGKYTKIIEEQGLGQAFVIKDWKKYAIHVVEPALHLFDWHTKIVSHNVISNDTNKIVSLTWANGMTTTFTTL